MKFSRLNRRERYALILGAAFICLYILTEFIVSPFMEKREQLRRSLSARVETLEKMRQLSAEYEELKNRAKVSEQHFALRPKGFTLFSFLDELAGKAGLKDNIEYMKPSKSKPKDSPYTVSLVEMKLRGINMRQLTPYLHMVETSPNMVFIRRASFSKSGDDGFMDVILQVEAREVS
ncbi:MAG: type II secretion system protein GspM [Desulfococcaceae bacterium]